MNKKNEKYPGVTIAIDSQVHGDFKSVAGAKRIPLRKAATLAVREWTERESKSALRELVAKWRK